MKYFYVIHVLNRDNEYLYTCAIAFKTRKKAEEYAYNH